jgi:hypothetical protein
MAILDVRFSGNPTVVVAVRARISTTKIGSTFSRSGSRGMEWIEKIENTERLQVE